MDNTVQYEYDVSQHNTTRQHREEYNTTQKNNTTNYHNGQHRSGIQTAGRRSKIDIVTGVTNEMRDILAMTQAMIIKLTNSSSMMTNTQPRRKRSKRTPWRRRRIKKQKEVRQFLIHIFLFRRTEI